MKIDPNEPKSYYGSGNGGVSAALTDYAHGERHDWHCHDEFVIAMLVRGNVREQVKCDDIVVHPFVVGIKSPDIRHSDEFCPNGVRVIRLAIDPKLVESLKRMELVREGWYWQQSPDAVRPFLRVGRDLARGRTDVSEHVLEILAAIGKPGSETLEGDPPQWLRRARQLLDDAATEGIGLSRLAEEASVHPVYFARKFRQYFGCTVSDYSRRRKLDVARSLMNSNTNRFADIAVDAGFADQAHLNRAFKYEFGLTPGEFRRILE